MCIQCIFLIWKKWKITNWINNWQIRVVKLYWKMMKYFVGLRFNIINMKVSCLPVVNGGWGAWQAWTPCYPVSCWFGTKLRTRPCNNPLPMYGGQYCSGNPTEIINCLRGQCPGKCFSVYQKGIWWAGMECNGIVLHETMVNFTFIIK